MPWSATWPVERWSPLDHDTVFNELRLALAERDALTPAGHVPDQYARLDTVEGHGPSEQALGRLQLQIAGMLSELNPWRWWDRSRGQLLTLANLLSDTIGRTDWTVDLNAAGAAWSPPAALTFNELRDATNGLKCLRRLTPSAISSRVDSIFEMTYGISNWAASRAAVFALFDGDDDAGDTGLAYDVGLSAMVFDSGAAQQWYGDARAVEIVFDTADLDGLTVSRAWLELNTAASGGSTDFSDTFTAEVVNASHVVRGTFASDDYSLKSLELDPADVNTAGDTVLTLRSARANAADRSAWSPTGPDYTSTYREGFDLSDTLRLVVEVDFEYRA